MDSHWPQPTRPFKYRRGQILKHYKGGEYVIVGLPDEYVQESTRECAYAYMSVKFPGGPKIIRSQSEIEQEQRFSAKDSYEQITTPK